MSLFGFGKKQDDPLLMQLDWRALQSSPPGALGPAGAPAPQKPRAPLPVRKSAEPVRAWREWYIVQREGAVIIRSVFRDNVWEGPILRADTKPADYTTPGATQETGHGIYAYPLTQRIPGPSPLFKNDFTSMSFSAMLAISLTGIPSGKREQLAGGTVEGEVELMGRVVRHSNGYRAESARIVRLWITQLESYLDREATIAALSERYQCDVGFMPKFTIPEPVAEPTKKQVRKRMKRAGLVMPTPEEYAQIMRVQNATR